MRKLMTELDDNVFINTWHCSVDEFCMNFHIYYIDSRCRRMTFDKESTEEEVRPHLLYLIDKDLKEGGWERLTQHQMLQQQEELEKKYNPAEDPYYEQDSLYVDKEIK